LRRIGSPVRGRYHRHVGLTDGAKDALPWCKLKQQQEISDQEVMAAALVGYLAVLAKLIPIIALTGVFFVYSVAPFG
jgi:hypothetical protein